MLVVRLTASSDLYTRQGDVDDGDGGDGVGRDGAGGGEDVGVVGLVAVLVVIAGGGDVGGSWGERRKGTLL